MSSDEDRSNLRDLHAGFALAGLIMRMGGGSPTIIAEQAYGLADAMQEARDQHRVGIVSIKRQTKKEKANETE
jgi:hypothetical protein